MPANRVTLSVHRLEQLTDGVYAIVMTLMVFGLDLPKGARPATGAALWSALAGMLPQMGHYFLCFLILGALWMANNHKMRLIKRTDQAHLTLSLLEMLMLCLLPFSTGLTGDYSGFVAAAVVFNANMLGLGLANHAVWRYAAGPGGLLADGVGAAEARQALRLSLVLPATALAALALSAWLPSWAGLAYAAMVPILRALRR